MRSMLKLLKLQRSRWSHANSIEGISKLYKKAYITGFDWLPLSIPRSNLRILDIGCGFGLYNIFLFWERKLRSSTLYLLDKTNEKPSGRVDGYN